MKQLKKIIYIFGLITILITLKSCGGSYESENREELSSAFEDLFHFNPPNSIEEIKVKNSVYYDTVMYWMYFTYSFDVIKKIISKDQELKIAFKNSSEFNQISEFIKKNTHNPKWLKLPNENTNQIYYKKDFKEHSVLSVYYIWSDSKSRKTYLYIHEY
ncbi:hypothetical protein [Faecalibacter rhinopitheci]|uniref:Uncharacterized protein n=1 Tax=Faecalibacter rhinopitheci TaxID=2779678 RepID=A0A8J7FT40_9FLAO|nr:hypothetical protein [Faecalibacter rhinopitheci]MBF0598438.1 hypothetical protein [Faecalibacter rhinopitheci]